MSNQTRNTELLSEQQIIDWLKIKPRTFGWDVALFYDRSTTNNLLRQKYNRDYHKEGGVSIPAAKVAIVDGRHWEYLYDQRLDAPRLSFEKSTLSRSRATLTMNILGGTQLTVEQEPSSPKRVTKVEVHDPLQGPKLIAGINLDEADGVVTNGGKAQFDLSKGLDFKLTFGSTTHQQDKGGEFYEQLFDNLDDAKKIFVLNEFGDFDSEDLLQPRQFRVRGMPAPGAAVRGTENYGDGAVVVFISTLGGEVGSYPDDAFEWVYPIPAGHSSTLLMSHGLLMEHVLLGALGRADVPGKFRAVQSEKGNGFVEVHASSGSLPAHWLHMGDEYPPFDELELHADIDLVKEQGGGSGLAISLNSEGLFYEWTVNLSAPRRCQTKTYSRSEDSLVMTAYNLEWKMVRQARFSRHSNGVIYSEWSGPGKFIDDKVEPRTSVPPSYAPHIPMLKGAVRREALAQMDAVFDRAAISAVQIDDFRMHGLLFDNGNEVVSVKSVHAAADLALFGDLAPALTKFRIGPLDEVVAAGSKVTFTSFPSISNLTWSVEPISGFEEGAGTISASGIYTAPTATAIDGAYTMARIVAKYGQHSSSALIRVVKRGVVMNPLIVASSLTGGKVRMSAGTIDGGSLVWSIKSDSGAILVDAPPEGGAEFEAGDRFYIPGSSPTGRPFSVDEVTAMNPRTSASHTSYVLVVEKQLNGVLKIKEESGLPANKVKLELDGGEGSLDGTTFAVVAGGGSIDANGVYTVDEASPHKFGVVTASWRMAGVPISFDGYMILPVPLLDLESVRRALA